MSWEEFINHILATTTKVDKIAVFDSTGRPVAITDDVETCESEGFAISKCFSDSAKTVTRLSIDNDIYQCIHGVSTTLIGVKLKDPSHMLVARQDGDHFVLIIGQTDGQESFLRAIRDALQKKAEGKLTGQVQPLPPSLPIPPSPGSKKGNQRLVATEEVLVDITG